MEHYIIAYSRYFIACLMAACTLLSFRRVLSAGRREDSVRQAGSGWDNLQSVLIFLIQFAAFLTMCVEKGTVDYLFFYALSQVVLFAAMALFLMIYPGTDRLILNNMCLLLGTGFMMLARLDLSRAVKQLVIAALSLGISMAVPFLMEKGADMVKRLTWVWLGTGLAVLSAVLILGEVTHGSRLSFGILGITFQPSEFVKLIFVFGVAALLWRRASLKELTICGCAAAAHVLVLVLSRDLGSAVIFYAAFVFMAFFASGKIRYLLLGGAGGVAASCIAYRLFSHVRIRVQAWKDPWSVIDDQGFQITQSLFAMSRGGWFGLGIGQGTPKDIPFVETDFIFAAVTEEMGIVFSVCVILICVSCFLAFIRVAEEERDRFYSLVASGLGVMYIFQIFLTIGGGTKFIPLTGVTLPFISYGGSSVMATCLLFAVIQGICLKQKRDRERERRRAGRRKRAAGRDRTDRREEYEEEYEYDR